MDDRTKTALEGSIAKWQRIVAGDGQDHGPLNCPLCREFRNGADCAGCPVAQRTGEKYCDGTPYDDWGMALGLRAGGDGYDISLNQITNLKARERFRALAQAELDFLISLRESQP